MPDAIPGTSPTWMLKFAAGVQGGNTFAMQRSMHLLWGSMHSEGHSENCEVQRVLIDHWSA
jgi:hypothetical protein